MTDKILTEAFDKLKAIEESEDPFCIGAKDEPVVEAYTEVEEAEHPADAFGISRDNDEPAPERGYEEPKVYQIDTNHGDNYAVHFQDDGDAEHAFVEVNGITVATYVVGGAGAMDARIKDPAAVLDALTHALHAANGSEGT